MQEIFEITDPEAIYNMNESGMPLEPQPPKVVPKKGQKKVVIKHLDRNSR